VHRLTGHSISGKSMCGMGLFTVLRETHSR
jgi:hypothetical protein